MFFIDLPSHGQPTAVDQVNKGGGEGPRAVDSVAGTRFGDGDSSAVHVHLGAFSAGQSARHQLPVVAKQVVDGAVDRRLRIGLVGDDVLGADGLASVDVHELGLQGLRVIGTRGRNVGQHVDQIVQGL